MQNLTIKGREFTAQAYTGRGAQHMPWILTGKRGAVYGAFRNDDGTMSVRSYTSGELRINGNAVILTDADFAR